MTAVEYRQWTYAGRVIAAGVTKHSWMAAVWLFVGPIGLEVRLDLHHTMGSKLVWRFGSIDVGYLE